ncbi:MAG TPA: carboxymuconolactone decarboxylase family protein [Pseudomonadales bacterium]|nr:carboxymuconolactone decarboxylase family protein [Gammaproteobacteria bacterium]HIM36239.1 carboxymuconolactone decarboxylase family protein [Pseudomonadales bacterium]
MLPKEEAERRAKDQGIQERFAELCVFRILLTHPSLAREVANTLTSLLFEDNVLDPRLRELLIMRIAWIRGSDYEWTQHWRVARGLDIPRADLLAVQNWNHASHLSDADRAVLQATDDCLDVGFIQPSTWDSIKVHLKTEAEQIELVIAIGNWMQFAQLLRSLNVPLEDGVRSWPPTGVGPHA